MLDCALEEDVIGEGVQDNCEACSKRGYLNSTLGLGV